jgi:hypothetical protein
MQGWLTAGKTDARDVRCIARFDDNSLEEFNRKELSVSAVEIFVGTKTITTMQIADVGQLHTQTLWTIITGKGGVGFH